MISLIGATDAGGFQTSVTVTLPTGVEDGDRLLLLASANDENTITSLPSGWAVLVEEEIGTGVSVWVFARTADGEPADYTVTWSGDNWHFLNLVAFRGVDAIRSFAVASDDASATIDLPSLTAETGDALVAFGFNDEETSKSWPGALAEITNLPRGIISAWEADLTAGPTTAYTLTCGTSGHVTATAILLTATPETDPEVTFPLIIRTELQLDGVWTDISSEVRDDPDDVIITRGRSDWADQADPASMTLKLNNRDGQFSPRNPRSPHFGALRRNTPIRVSLVVNGDVVTRFAGEVPEWPVKWDLSGNDVWITLRAAGLLRRFAQGAGPAWAAIRRLINRSSPLAYWPLTDGEGATFRAAPDVGPNPMHVTDLIRTAGGTVFSKLDFLDWAQGSLEPWLEPVARTRTDRGAITGRVDPVDTSPVAWTADVVRSRSGGEDRFTVTSHLDDDDVGVQWRLRLDFAVPDIRLFVREFTGSPSGTFTELAVIDEPRFFDDEMRHLRLTVTESGADSDWQVFIDGQLIDSGTATGFEARPAATVTYSWSFLAGGLPDDAEHAHVGHIALWDSTTDLVVPSAADVRRALDGRPGERAGVRIERIAREEGITLHVIGDLEQTPPVGPQYAESALEVMRDAESVDHGVLFESRDEAALVYRTNRSRFNQHLGGV